MRRIRFRWSVLLAGGVLLQLAGCPQLAGETLVRIGFSTFFLPLNRAIAAFLSTGT